MGSGHVLATMATGRLSSDLEEKSGLVPTHAYALLDLRQVGNLRFVKLKNPWAERSWKGKYSYQVCEVVVEEELWLDFIIIVLHGHMRMDTYILYSLRYIYRVI